MTIQQLPGLLLILFLYVTAHSQDQPSAPPLEMNISYFGETITHPGLKIGMESALSQKSREKIKRTGKTFTKRKLLFLATSLGGYHQHRFHTGIFINGEIGYRVTKKKGIKTELLVGLGYLRTFVDGDTYGVDDSGNIHRQRHEGQSGVMPSIAFGVGKDLRFTEQGAWSWHIRPSLYFQVPYNHTYLPHFILETGMTFSPGSIKIRKSK